MVLVGGLFTSASARTPQAQWTIVLALPTQSGSRAPTRDDVLDLLSSARSLMEQGDLDAAEQAIADAESLNVSFGVLHLGDTPKKARRDLERYKARAPKRPEKSPWDGAAASQAAPAKSPTPRATPSPAQAVTNDVAAPRLLPAAPATPEMQLITAPPSSEAITLPGNQDLRAPAAAPSSGGSPLLAARRALAMGNLAQASALLDQAKRAPQRSAPGGDTPARVDVLIRKQQAVNDALATQGDSEQLRLDMIDLAMEQAEDLLEWGELDLAEQLANRSAQVAGENGQFQAAIDALFDRIHLARGDQPSTIQPHAPRPLPPVAAAPEPPLQNPAGVMRAEYQVAPSAAASGVARTNFEFPADEPADSPFDQAPQRAAAAVAPAMPTSAQPVAPAAAIEQPRATASQVQIVNDASRARFYLQQGEVALQKGDNNTALAHFQRAQRLEQELDTHERARLVQHLTLAQKQRSENVPADYPQTENIGAAPVAEVPLSRQQPAVPLQRVDLGSAAPQPLPPPQEPGGLLNQYTAGQRLLQRQLAAEVANQQSRAKQMRELDPKMALELLAQTQQLIESSQVEPEFRAQLLNRVARTREDVQAYYDAHKADFELQEQNDAVLGEIDRERSMKIEIDEKLAALVDEYNKLMDEERWAEAELTAKKAIELAPNNPLAEQLRWNANFARRFKQQRQIDLDKESGFVDQLASVDQASIPFDDRNPIRFPDKLQWKDLVDRRKRLTDGDGPRRNPRELQIEQKLKTPVSLQFTDAALGQVLDHLAELSDINIHVDPQGLAAEGVATDTPITINLKQEISLKSALNLILEPLHLGYVIKDEVLKITSEQFRNGELAVRMYPVADLVIPIPNFVPNGRMGLEASLQNAYTSLGYGGTSGFTSQSPLAVVASKDGNPNSAMMNPALLANVGTNSGTMAGQLLGSHAPVGAGPGGAGGGAAADFDSLIQLITSTIEPTSWAEVGGSGAIEEFRTNLSLVISQTEDVHDQIRDLLAQLRRLQDLQVTIEVRFITLNDNFFERIGVDFDFNINDNTDRPLQFFGQPIQGAQAQPIPDSPFVGVPRNFTERDFNKQNTTVVGMSAPNVFSADLDIPFRQNSFGLAVPQFGGFDPTAGASIGFAILSDIEAFFFINAAQGDRRTNVLQAPKVTLFNGQQATVSDTSQSPFVISVIPVVGDFAAAQQPVIVVLNEGTFMTVQATVSPDRRFVRLTVVPFFSSIGEVNTFTFEGSRTTRERSQSDGPSDETTSREQDVETTVSGTTVQLPTFAFVTVTTTVSVPDGGTILLGGIKRLSEGRSEFGVPILSKLPYINRLFKNVGIGRETQSLMMMVTPRIIIQEEEEALLGLAPASP